MSKGGRQKSLSVSEQQYDFLFKGAQGFGLVALVGLELCCLPASP